MAGILDMDPKQQALIGLAQGLLAGSAPSRLPISMGQAMGMGAEGMLSGYQRGKALEFQEMQRKLQEQQFEQQKQVQGMRDEALKWLETKDPVMARFARINPAILDDVVKAMYQQPKLERIETLDDNQRPVQKFVTPQAGGTYPMVPKEQKDANYQRDELPVPGKDGWWQKWSLDPKTQQPVAPIGEPYQKKSPSTSQTVVLPPAENAEAKKVGEWRGEMYAKVQTAGMEASGKIARYDRLAQLLDGVETGKLTPAGTELAGYLASVGIKVDPNLDNKQAAATLSAELALQARNPSGGAGMPGAMSDQDRKYLSDMIPNLSKTPGGNRLIIETMKRLAQRDKEVAQFVYRYRAKNKNLDGVEEALEAWSNANPLFADMPQGDTAPQSGLTPAEEKRRQELKKKYGR